MTDRGALERGLKMFIGDKNSSYSVSIVSEIKKGNYTLSIPGK